MKIKKRDYDFNLTEQENKPSKKEYDLEDVNNTYSKQDLEDQPLDYNDNNQLFNEDLNDNMYFGDGGGYSPPMDKHNDLLKELTNFSPFLKQTINNWLGVHWNESEEKYIPNPNIIPIMNLNGASWCVGRLQIYTRSNNIITDISSDDYRFINEDIIEEMWINIGTKSEEFGIYNEGDILRVCNEMIHASTLVLMGAGDGRYNKFLGTTITRHENVNPGSQDYQMSPQYFKPKKAGFMSKLGKLFTGM